MPRELGIRMSLGADSRMVQRMILGEGGVLLGVGLGLGVIGYNVSGLWESTSAISRIRATASTGNWKSGSKMLVFGAPAA